MMQHIATGNTAEIYLHNGNIMKVYTRESVETVAREAENQAYARSLGLPVPEVIELTRFNGRSALVMEYASGAAMGELLLRDPTTMQASFSRVVEIQREVHSKIAPELRAMSDRLREKIDSVRQLANRQKSGLLSMLDDIGDESHLCHGDLHVLNLIVDDSRVMIIDWMDATRGDIRLDVCRSYLLYSGVDADVATYYLHEFCHQSGLDQNEIMRWLPVIAAARLSEGIDAEEEQRLLSLIEAIPHGSAKETT